MSSAATYGKPRTLKDRLMRREDLQASPSGKAPQFTVTRSLVGVCLGWVIVPMCPCAAKMAVT